MRVIALMVLTLGTLYLSDLSAMAMSADFAPLRGAALSLDGLSQVLQQTAER